MKILFDHHDPFLLAHGGFQLQIEETKRALDETGVSVQYLQWWDNHSAPDLIHFFGVAPIDYIERAHRKSVKVVQTALLTESCNRSDSQLRRQGFVIRSLLALPFGRNVKRQLRWSSFPAVDMNVVGLEAERQVLELAYGIEPESIVNVPLGVSTPFLERDRATSRGEFLIIVGTITERKNSVLLAKMARKAKVPLLFVGKPYSEQDPYWLEFKSLIDDRYVRLQSHVDDAAELAELYRSARGCVGLSWYENWCLVAHEAAACGLPLLLRRQKWSVERFGSEASYFSHGGFAANVRELQAFYERPAPLPRVKLYSWIEVAQQLRQIYERVLSTSS